MATIRIYLPDEVAEKVRIAAASEGTSVSRWISHRISEIADKRWSAAFLNAAGSVPDFPEIDEAREEYGVDARREDWN